MDKEQRKAKKFVIALFLFCLCIALVFFGICAYLVITYRGSELVNTSIVNFSKGLALAGVFFLVLAFGYLLPILISRQNKNINKGEPKVSGIFDETKMRQLLGKYIPDGETLLAGIHAVSKETHITGVFGKCICTENGFLPSESGNIIALSKEKFATYDIYLGITQSFLIITGCERNKYFYQFDENPSVTNAEVQEVTSDLFFADIGTCFPLTDIQSCEIKKGWMGSVNCFLKMKNGSYFKLMLPKLGGLGDGMPHHTQYRDAIIACLGNR